MRTFTVKFRTGDNRHNWNNWIVTIQAQDIARAFPRALRIAERKNAELIGVYLSGE